MNFSLLQFPFLKFLRTISRKCKKLTSLTLYDYVEIDDEEMHTQNEDVFPTFTYISIEVFYEKEELFKMNLVAQLEKKNEFIEDFKKFLEVKFPNLTNAIQVDDQTDDDVFKHIQFTSRRPAKC